MTEEALGLVERKVREEIRRRGLAPDSGGAGGVGAIVEEVLDDYAARVATSNLPRIDDRPRAVKRLIDNIEGYGDLQPLLDDPEVEEIWVNGPGRVFCARSGKHLLTNVALSDVQLREVVERMLRSSGRRLDMASPFVDATLPDGSRLHVVIPNISRRYWAVNIRKFVLRAHRLDELVRLGSLTQHAAEFLSGTVQAGLNVLISGATQAGKTTMLNCLAAAIPGHDRVITCEEVFELRVDLPDVVAMQTRSPSVEGTGEVDLRRLISEALRMRPDRIIVGEVRGREAFDLLVALNCGLPGMTSVHANTAVDALRKMTALPLLAGENVTQTFVLPTVASTIDIVVHLSQRRGRRVTSQILGVTGRVEGEAIETVTLFDRRGGELGWTGQYPPAAERYAAAGINLREMFR